MNSTAAIRVLLYGVLASSVLAFIALYPQARMIYLRGDAWNGHYAYTDVDEVAYAAYIQALIDGRPRKNDPYSGRDEAAETPQPESPFSIQFAAAYIVAIPARVLGIGAPLAMILAGAIFAFLSGSALFVLLLRITDDPLFSLAGSLAVFCFGTLAAGEGAITEIIFDQIAYPFFPAFRRYIPAAGIPAFFLMIGFIWMLISRSQDSTRLRYVYISLGILCFGFMVYSYFYLWTMAAALLVVWAAITAILRPEGWKHDLRAFALIALGSLVLHLPYFYMLSGRSPAVDDVQLLVETRIPDLFRWPEIICAAVILTLLVGANYKYVPLNARGVILALALAASVFAVFNQQVLTGHSLQPIHYQVFIGNYVAMLAVFIAAWIFLHRFLRPGTTHHNAAYWVLAASAVVWGLVECHYTVRAVDEANIARDRSRPVLDRLRQLAATDDDPHRKTVFFFDSVVADDALSVAPQNVLWAHHQQIFTGLTRNEARGRFMKYLYYRNVDPEALHRSITRDAVATIALFGWDRHTDRLSSKARPLTEIEVGAAVDEYKRYRAFFNRKLASEPKLAYVVVPNTITADLTNIERWYELELTEHVGGQTIYRAMLK
jgi:hypothetical protein